MRKVIVGIDLARYEKETGQKGFDLPLRCPIMTGNGVV
jgi:hypothetical protein